MMTKTSESVSASFHSQHVLNYRNRNRNRNSSSQSSNVRSSPAAAAAKDDKNKEEEVADDAFAETREKRNDDYDSNNNLSIKKWECSQCFGNQSLLVSQLRDVSEVLSNGFNEPADDLLNGLMQKTRWSAGNFTCVIARPYGSEPYKPSKRLTVKSVKRKERQTTTTTTTTTQNEEQTRESQFSLALQSTTTSTTSSSSTFREGNDIVGACDLTLLPAFGPKASRESRVKKGVKLLKLSNESTFLYLTGMTTRSENRRMGVAKALLEECDIIAERMQNSRPKCICLHVEKKNTSAIRLYESCGYRTISEDDEKNVLLDGGETPSSLANKFLNFANKIGAAAGSSNEAPTHFMCKWIREDVIDEAVRKIDDVGVLKLRPTL